MDSSRLEPPSGLLARLRQLPGYSWDEDREPFHSSYDIWHIFGTKHDAERPTPHTTTSTSRIRRTKSGSGAQSGSQVDEEDASGEYLRDADKPGLPIVARVSMHVLREERAYHICKTLASRVDATGEHLSRPIERLRLSGLADEGPISVCVFADCGPNYLSKVVDYGPGWFKLQIDGDTIRERQDESFVPQEISLQTFLDFAIGAAECIEVLHGQQIVHGEVRGDAFHMDLETGKVILINLGPGRLRTIEQGLTSSGWSKMSKELGAKTKLSYMSPEQTGRMPLEPDSRTDIFSLGVLLWNILSQKSAFEGDTPMAIVQAVLGQRLPLISNMRLDIPEVIGRILQKATAKSVWDRYHSVRGLRYDLVEIRRLLSAGESSQLSSWEIGTKDISASFILPQAMIGRAAEHDAIVAVIDRAYKSHQASQRPEKHIAVHLSRLSEDISSDFEGAHNLARVSTEDDNTSSADAQTNRSSFSDHLNDSRPYKGDDRRSRSHSSSLHESIDIPIASLADHDYASPDKLSKKRSRLLELPAASNSDVSESDKSGVVPDATGIKGNIMGTRTKGRCEVFTIAGTTGLGKSRLIQSVQVEARQRGYFASSKFYHSQSDRRPFDTILKLLASLFQQVFSESNMDPAFHQLLKRRVAPVWSVLHKTLGLPEFLFGSKLPIRTASQSKSLNVSRGPGLERRSSSPRSPSLGSGLPQQSTQSPQHFLRPGASSQSLSAISTILDILRIFAQYNFICLGLDDLHFADDDSLELISQMIATRISMVLLVTYRPDSALSGTVKHMLDSQYSDAQQHGVIFTSIQLKPFSEDETVEYVATTLRRPKKEVFPLAAAVQFKTAGNPFYVKEMLNACYQQKSIWFDYRESAWLFDLDLMQFKSEGSIATFHETLVMSRFDELPDSSKSILSWASMLGSTFSFQLILRLLSNDSTPSNLFCNEHDAMKGLQASIQSYIVVPTQNDDIFRFSHDRYIQAAASLGKGDEHSMHFVLAKTLVKYYSLGDRYRSIAASAICEAVNIIKPSVEHRHSFRKVLLEYAQLASESGIRTAAVQVYACCITLLQDDMWDDTKEDVIYEETLQVFTGAAECYLYVGQYDEARRLLLSVTINAKSAVDKARAWILQSRAFAQEGDSTRAFRALKDCLVALGVQVEDDPTFLNCDTKFKSLCEKIQSIGPVNLIKEPSSEDLLNITAIGSVLTEATSAAFWSDTLTFYAMNLLMVEMSLTSGSFPQSGMGYLQLGLIAVTRHNMINFANECGQIALQLIERWKDPYTMGRGGTLYPSFLGHIQHPLHTSISHLDRALDYAIQAGDRISTILNIGFMSTLKFFASENMAELESFSSYACQDIPDWQSDTPGGTMIISIRQACRALQGKTRTDDPSMGVMTDDDHSSLQYKSWLLSTVKNSDRPILLYESIEICPLFLFGHFTNAVAIGNSSMKKINAIWSARNTRFLMFFHSLSLAGDLWIKVEAQLDPKYRGDSAQLSSDTGGRTLESGLQEEIAGLIMLIKYFKRRIEQWQAVTDVNYLAWSKMLGAQIAEMENDHLTALRCYEDAIEHASIHEFGLEEALANNLMGEHLLRIGSRRLAKLALRESICMYQHIGAVGVATHIQNKHFHIFQGGRFKPTTVEVATQTETFDHLNSVQPHTAGFDHGGLPASEAMFQQKEATDDRIGTWREGSALVDTSSGPALHMLDLASIIESSQVISSVLQVDQLLRTMCEIILQNSKGIASLAVIAIEDPSVGWGIAASGHPEEGAEAHNPTLPLANSALVVESVVNYCSRFRETVFIPDLMQDQQFSNVNSSWAARNPDSKSVIAIPICHGDDSQPLLGVLYLEGQPNSFKNRNLEVLQLLVNQIAISYSNSLTLKEVERVSAVNKSMVEVQKKALSEAIVARNNADIARAEAFRSAKLAEEAAKLAEEAAKAKATFLANISHELRTPLNGVIGNSELLLLDKSLQENQAEMADSIRVSANLLLSLINDILDFSKIEANQMQLHRTSFYVREMVQEMVRSIPSARKQSKSQDVRILQDFDFPQSLVYGDPVRLHQILGNLVGNSLKFTEKGSITIGAKVESENDTELRLKFWVKDTGIGIPAQQVHKLFKPFSQADASTSRKYGGSGLGLSICKSLVESMGGSIQLDSSENIGTTVSFSLTLPKAAPEPSTPIKTPISAVPSPSPEHPPNLPTRLSHIPLSHLRVCIAEDNLINQKIAVQFLQKLKIPHIDAFSNGLAAVEGIRRQAALGTPYHMILMDVQMPVLDGYDATKMLRRDKNESVRGILVIALTASAIQGDREKCLESGMNDYLAKPIRLAVLRGKVGEYLRLE